MSKTTPTNEIPAIVAMRLGVDYRCNISCRGLNLTLRPLSMSETIRVASEVSAELEQVPAKYRNAITENSLLAKKTLVIASTSDVGQDDFSVSDYILDRMTPDELQYLYKQYVDVCDRANPALETMSDKDLLVLVEEVKKNPSLRTELSRSQLLSLVNFFSTSVE